jgi:glutamate--cysteine ligase
MPEMSLRTDSTTLGEEEAVAHVHGICLKTGPPHRIGVELEWLVRDAHNPVLPVQAERTAAAVGARAAGRPAELPSSSSPRVLPSGALLTAEPGGQLEISSAPADSLAECVSATAADLTVVRDAAATAGLELAGFGMDPHRPPRRVASLPRYAAMEAYFDRGGPWGRWMMCSTASVQVCLDAGDDGRGHTGFRRRWRLLHAISPVLLAAFANSPLRGGRPTGWRSSRQQIWGLLDPGRTRPPGGASADPREAWAAYALDAGLMVVRDRASADWTAPPGMTFRDWLRDAGSTLRRPDADDLGYHLSTLFPPIRPHGYLELRVIDAQPGDDGWMVPLAVVSALADDERAADAAMAAVEPLWAGHATAGDWPRAETFRGESPWVTAARCGPENARIAEASRKCFEAARAALARQRVPSAIRAAVDSFVERYVHKDRCPADDLLEEVT